MGFGLYDIFMRGKQRNLIKIKNVKEIGHMISYEITLTFE